MPWKIALVGFLAAAFVMTLGPASLFLVGGTIALLIVGLVLTLSVLAVVSPRAYTGGGRGQGQGRGQNGRSAGNVSQANGAPGGAPMEPPVQ